MSETSQWRAQTEAAAKRAREGIADAALASDMQRVNALTQALRPLEDALDSLLKARKTWQSQITQIEELNQSDHTKAPQTKLRITLDWPSAGYSRPIEVIAQPKAAESLAHCLASFSAVYGPDCLSRLITIRVGKAGLVSRTPAADFINPSTGAIYGHRPVASTGWFVHTGTSTELKADHIRQAASLAGFPARALRLEIIPKLSSLCL
jgi:hypothetical protein